MEKVSISHHNNINHVWMQLLDLYKKEINTLSEKLSAIATKNDDPYVLQKTNGYKGQFDAQLSSIRRLQNDISSSIPNLANLAQHIKDGFIDYTLLLKHNQLKDRFITEEKIFHEIRNGFKLFDANLANWASSHPSNVPIMLL
ncbi:MAG: hypothetical protein P4L41_08790 [Flavipsychrobacter sp.]|nr:hypothetical protein [Flavipsychrobacter sp.]